MQAFGGEGREACKPTIGPSSPHLFKEQTAMKESLASESRQEEASKGLEKEKRANRKDGKGRVEKEPMAVSSLYTLYTSALNLSKNINTTLCLEIRLDG